MVHKDEKLIQTNTHAHQHTNTERVHPVSAGIIKCSEASGQQSSWHDIIEPETAHFLLVELLCCAGSQSFFNVISKRT